VEEMKRFLLKLDIQTFSSDEVIQGGYVPEEREPVANPLLEEEPEMVEPVEETPAEEPQVELFDFSGRKVSPSDAEALKGLHEDWQNSQRYIQQLQQERQQLMEYQQSLMQQQQPKVEEPQVNEEELNEKLMEEFYENPSQFFSKLKQEALAEVKKEFEPMQKQQRYQREIQEVSTKHQDFNQLVPQIQEVIQQVGEDRAEELGLENLYYMAKGRIQQPNPQELFNDVNFVKQQVMSNEQLKNELLKEFMQNRQQSQPKAPVMGSNQGGTQSYTPQVRPRSIEEATRMARQFYGY
jgi:hypothetical protein